MSKKILVNATLQEESRVAIVEDGILTGLDIEVAGREPSKGNIYKAVVVRVESGLQAAFVDYGAERLGFLQIDEVNYATVKPELQDKEDGRRPRISDLLHRGQEILVQIVKEERGTKGAALTTYLSLAGRFMVLMPGSDTRGVSRRAESDSQRKQLKKAMSTLDLAEGVGYIVRTAALDQTREELERDYLYLMRLYESICELEKKVKAPTLIYKESNLIIRSIRDYFTTDMDEVLIDDPQVFQEAKDFFQLVMPDHVHLVKLHQERRPIFSRYQIEDQIDTLSRNKVSLPSGGSIVIDPTEALVAIDVNSGKMSSEQGVEATATKTNLEAAAEVGRQLRLRDLGGLIVIDFIDMRESKHMRQVEAQLKKSLEHDKARVSVGRISQFGLLEMSRQRIKAALTQGSHLTCPHCHGAGHIKSPESQAAALLRRIHAAAAKGQVARVEALLPQNVASYLLNYKREELLELERRYQLQVHILGSPDFMADQVEIEIQKKEKERTSQPEPVEARTLPPVADEEKKPAAKAEKAKQDAKPPVEPPDVDAPAPSEEAEPAKKKRRRRRRKPAGDKPEGEATAREDATEAASAEEEDAEDLADEPQAPSAAGGEGDTPAKKPRRRRSRGKGRAKAAPSEGAAPGTEASAAGSAPDMTTQAEPAVAVSAAPPTVDPVPQPLQDAGPAAVTAPAEPQPKPKRPRRSAKKKAAPPTAAASGPAPVEKAAGSAEDAVVQSPPVELPAAAVTAAPASPETIAEGKAAKPARKAPAKRTPRKAPAKPAAAKSDAPTPAAATEIPAADSAPPAEKPEPKRRRPAKSKPADSPPATQPLTETTP